MERSKAGLKLESNPKATHSRQQAYLGGNLISLTQQKFAET